MEQKTSRKKLLFKDLKIGEVFLLPAYNTFLMKIPLADAGYNAIFLTGDSFSKLEDNFLVTKINGQFVEE